MTLIARERINKLALSYHEQGKRIVFTNGCFDVLHPGHFKLLLKAAEEGDTLIVGINSDNSVKNLKGSGRPYFPAEERAFMVDQMKCVDHVVIFNEDTAINLIKEIRPHIYVKGGDYLTQILPERDILEQLGGRLILLPLVGSYSTTGIIGKMKGKTHE